MENPVDHTLDLGFVNYVQHPENQNYIVFRFRDEQRAKTFQTELETQKIWFETSTEDKKGRTHYLFGIHKNDFKKVEQINYKTEAKHKNKFIPWTGFRWLILILGLSALILATMGYCKSREHLQKVNQEYQTQ